MRSELQTSFGPTHRNATAGLAGNAAAGGFCAGCTAGCGGAASTGGGDGFVAFGGPGVAAVGAADAAVVSGALAGVAGERPKTYHTPAMSPTTITAAATSTGAIENDADDVDFGAETAAGDGGGSAITGGALLVDIGAV